jgi:hypothetical protein
LPVLRSVNGSGILRGGFALVVAGISGEVDRQLSAQLTPLNQR